MIKTFAAWVKSLNFTNLRGLVTAVFKEKWLFFSKDCLAFNSSIQKLIKVSMLSHTLTNHRLTFHNQPFSMGIDQRFYTFLREFCQAPVTCNTTTFGPCDNIWLKIKKIENTQHKNKIDKKQTTKAGRSIRLPSVDEEWINWSQ